MTLIRVGKLASDVVENCRTKIEKKRETAEVLESVSSLSNDPGRQQNGVSRSATGGMPGSVGSDEPKKEPGRTG